MRLWIDVGFKSGLVTVGAWVCGLGGGIIGARDIGALLSQMQGLVLTVVGTIGVFERLTIGLCGRPWHGTPEPQHAQHVHEPLETRLAPAGLRLLSCVVLL